MNPFALVTVIVLLGGLIYGGGKISLWIPAATFVAACGGMVVVWRHECREAEQRRRAAGGINYPELSGIDVLTYGPWVKQNLRGHDVVVDQILTTLQEELSLAGPGKNLGAFLLVGPTGTGKTFLAHLIAQVVYPDSPPVFLRMNQYKHADDVFTLIGAPPGRPGFELGGSLTRPVMENPRRVVILDELEKAHPDLHHCLYDILDTASCREKSSGKMVDFSGCVFFATCNAGAEILRGVYERTAEPAARLGQARNVLAEAAGFEKSFLARWHRIELMDELPLLQVAEVACLQLAKHWRGFGIEVNYTSPELILEAVEKNAEFQQYGVRQLGAFLKTKTNAAIVQARAANVKQVRLLAGEDGQLVVQACEPGEEHVA